jgi:hypothetical protein
LGFYESSSIFEFWEVGEFFLKIVPSLNCNWTLFMTTYHPSFTDKDLPSILHGQGLTIYPSWTRTYHPSFMDKDLPSILHGVLVEVMELDT